MLEHYRSLVDGSRSIACRIDSQRDEQVWLGLAWLGSLGCNGRAGVASQPARRKWRCVHARFVAPLRRSAAAVQPHWCGSMRAGVNEAEPLCCCVVD